MAACRGGSTRAFGEFDEDGVVTMPDRGRALAGLCDQGAPLVEGSGLPGGGTIPEPGAIAFLLPAAVLLRRRR